MTASIIRFVFILLLFGIGSYILWRFVPRQVRTVLLQETRWVSVFLLLALIFVVILWSFTL